MTRILKFALFAALAARTAWTIAAPNEIKVFSDEIAGDGKRTYETHFNKASRAGPRAENQRAPFQIMPEASYGLGHDWEISLQLPATLGGNGLRSEGYRTELQYVAPHDGERGFYWGFNAELARTERAGTPGFWSAGFTPILGYRIGRWHLVGNPAVEKAISGSARAANWQPAAKISYHAFERNYFGVEYYVEAGPLRQRLPGNEQSRVLYFVWDGKAGTSDINLGIGRGLTDGSDRWVIKMIYEFAF